MRHKDCVENLSFDEICRYNDEKIVILKGCDMDDMDRTILGLLSADARMSVATLARRLKVARSTVQARLERLEASGIIAGYTLKLG